MKRRAVSEILGVIILLTIVVGAFGVVSAYFLTQSNTQSANIIQQYQQGKIKAGELLSLIYHWENSEGTTVNIGLYNYGYYTITFKQVYISGVLIPASDWSIVNASNSETLSCGCIPQGQFVIVQLDDLPSQVASLVTSTSGYQFFAYGSDGLAYVWQL